MIEEFEIEESNIAIDDPNRLESFDSEENLNLETPDHKPEKVALHIKEKMLLSFMLILYYLVYLSDNYFPKFNHDVKMTHLVIMASIEIGKFFFAASNNFNVSIKFSFAKIILSYSLMINYPVFVLTDILNFILFIILQCLFLLSLSILERLLAYNSETNKGVSIFIYTLLGICVILHLSFIYVAYLHDKIGFAYISAIYFIILMYNSLILSNTSLYYKFDVLMDWLYYMYTAYLIVLYIYPCGVEYLSKLEQ
ncbi:hypothetical protein TUBRATIS_17920 [Tubulinosema ratisbonensis]|uniref:Uncharacterized protein n=1 Tax=Tubulinosema ratisbonensis TaxID=291195 RepID=A0A437AKM9_9MICR|nr:hypothetical protein TUBRATIS_17920 [Tubulinosema ratisbonensis]